MVKTNDIKKIFGNRVKHFRNKCNMTQLQLAEKVSLDTSFIGKIEIGATFVSIENLCNISNALNVKPYELFMTEEIEDGSQSKNEIAELINKSLKNCSKDKLLCIYDVIKSIKKL